MDNSIMLRTKKFRWNSKKSLYNYFQKYYNVGREVVNNEITNSLKTFKRRQGEPHRPAELWQKVGLTLEKNNDAVREFNAAPYDYGIIASYVCTASPFTLKPGRFVDIGIASILLTIQYGMSLFISYRLSG
jgi:hypothetical protein